MMSGIPLLLGLRTRMSDPYVYVVFWAPIALRTHRPRAAQPHLDSVGRGGANGRGGLGVRILSTSAVLSFSRSAYVFAPLLGTAPESKAP